MTGHSIKPSLPDQDYYHRVAEYYDEEAALFEGHYHNNPILKRIRTDFREITNQYFFNSVMEIGCGPGIDLAYFASKYPERKIIGIDVSPGMVQQAQAKLTDFPNAIASVGTPDTLAGCKFDLIYCFFGALNTVPDLSQTAERLASLLTKEGVMVLTFVNRWYWFDIVWNLLRLRWRRAWARPTNTWRGYAPDRPLQSYCRSAREIKKAFQPFAQLRKRKGYSIVFPAWYRHRFISTDGSLGNWLWRIDGLINRTPFWNLGEYSLYVFSAKK